MLVPATALVVVSVRMSAAQRRSRAASLRLLGLSRPGLRTVMAVETMLIAVPSALIGVVAYQVLATRLSRIPFTSLGFFSSDARIAGGVVLAITVAVLCAVAAVAVVVGREPEATVRPRLAPTRVHRGGVVLLAVGLVALLLLRWSENYPQTIAALALWVSIGTVSVGLALAGPVIVRAVAERLVQMARRGGTLVGLQVSAGDPGTSARMASVLSVVIVAIGATIPFIAILNGGSGNNAEASLARSSGVTIQASSELVELDAREIASWPGVRRTLPIRFGRGDRQQEEIPILGATCADLQAMIEPPLESCTGEPQWVSVNGDDSGKAYAAASSTLALRGGDTLALPGAANVVVARGLTYDVHGFLAVSPPVYAQLRPATADSLLVNVDSDRVALVLAKLSAAAPSAQVTTGDFAFTDPDQARFPDQVLWVVIGSVLCLGLGMLALTTAALGETVTRRTRIRGLLILGSPRSDVLLAHAGSTFLPVALLGLLASFVSWLTYQGMHGFDDRAVASPWLYPGLGLGAVVVSLVIAAVTAPPLMGELREDEVRATT